MNQAAVRVTILCFFVLVLIPACNWLTPLVIIADPKRKVTAEFDKLAGRRVAILVWTDQSTLFDYPHARLELATHLADKLSTELTQRQLGTSVTNPREVEDFLQKNPSARVDAVLVGQQFKSDFVIHVEVVEFQFRSPDHPQLLQGRINASVAVHDTRLPDAKGGRFPLAPVDCVFPEGAPVLMSATNSLMVREATYQKFAEIVARKFYEHESDQ
jgi:hypothetical protein